MHNDEMFVLAEAEEHNKGLRDAFQAYREPPLRNPSRVAGAGG